MRASHGTRWRNPPDSCTGPFRRSVDLHTLGGRWLPIQRVSCDPPVAVGGNGEELEAAGTLSVRTGTIALGLANVSRDTEINAT